MRRLRLLLPVLAATVAMLAPARAPAPTPKAARPALWKLADADTTIYLFGTIHVLSPNFRWRNATIDAAIARSSALTLETVLDTDPGKVGRLLATIGRAEGLPPLAERVPPPKRAALRALVAKAGFADGRLDGFKTWAAAIVLTGAAIQQIGVGATAENGVEPQLTAIFRRAGKPVEGLESPEQQLGFFDALPEASQRAFLEATVEGPTKTRLDFRRLVAGWARGDVAAIARAFADDPEFTPALRDALIRRRDRAWADLLARRLDTPGTIFVAVGAGHLVGPDSVQRMLAARGLQTQRVQ